MEINAENWTYTDNTEGYGEATKHVFEHNTEMMAVRIAPADGGFITKCPEGNWQLNFPRELVDSNIECFETEDEALDRAREWVATR